MPVVVIGAGVAGLAAAIRLRALGYGVRILEANAFPGGKLSEIQLGAYRFDAGPSLFTMPHLVEELYWISGKPSSPFSYRKLDEVCRYFFPDGTRFSAPAGEEERVAAMAGALGENPEVLRRYFADSRFRYETIGRLFTEKSLREPGTFFNREAFRAYASAGRLGLTETLHDLNRRVFRNPATVQLFDRYATYNGSDPYQTPAVMSLIPHLEFGIGAFFPEKGMAGIRDALTGLVQESGASLELNRPVSRIEVEGNRAVAVWSEGERIPAARVVSAVDVESTYRHLLAGTPYSASFRPQPGSTSAIIWYWGIRRQTPATGLHNLFFSSDYRAEFRALFQEKTMPGDPSIYLNISSKERPADAPDGCENWFVMVNAPPASGQDWERLVDETRSRVMSRLSRELGFEAGRFLEAETCLDPPALEKRTGSPGGTLYGSNSNSRLAAFLRHANTHRKIRNLFFCGGTVHPGGGIPLALQSAAIACRYLDRCRV